MKKFGAIIFNSLVVACGVLGQVFNALSAGFMASDSYLYYTLLSNVLITAVAGVMIAFEIRKLKGKTIPKGISVLQFVATVAITLTFLVFSLMLTPEMVAQGNAWYLVTPGNIFLHNLTPIFAILAWVFYGDASKIKCVECLYCVIPPLVYGATMLIRAGLGIKIAGNLVPYFFLDYERFGWFNISSKGIGVFYWTIIVFAGVVGVAFALRALAKIKDKKAKNNNL